MYKKYTLEQLLQIKNNFFPHLQNLLKKCGMPTLKKYLKIKQNNGYEWCTMERGRPVFRITSHSQGDYTFYDEKEKIELRVNEQNIDKLHNFIKNPQKVKKKLSQTKRIDALLLEKFTNGGFAHINHKPYLVYDIETTATTKDLTKTKFYLGYAYVVTGPSKGKYKFIGPDNLEKFVHFMRDFDGYIVGYNNIGFDNPVSVYNCSNRQQERIDEINAKSIDLFLFLRNLVGKRMGLNDVATSLIGIKKTLSSGAEGDKLMQQYQQTGQEKYLTEFKKYCKNDVKMTVLVLFYLLNRTSLYVDQQTYPYTKETFLTFCQQSRGKEQSSTKHAPQGMFV